MVGQHSFYSPLHLLSSNGFVSCDVKIGEDVSLDMEEHGDLWDGDLFVHDDQFAIDNYPLEGSIKKEIEGNPLLKSSNENNVVESIETFSGFYDQSIEKHLPNESDENAADTNRRYPKRLSKIPVNVNTVIKTEDLSFKQSEVSVKIPKKRERKPKSLAEKRLMLQLANQYKNKKKRGRPKGSGNKSRLEKLKQVRQITGVIYNLRNLCKKENNHSDKNVTSKLSLDENQGVMNIKLSDGGSREINRFHYSKFPRRSLITSVKEKDFHSSKFKTEREQDFISLRNIKGQETNLSYTNIESDLISSNSYFSMASSFISTSGTNTLTTTTADPVSNIPSATTASFSCPSKNSFSSSLSTKETIFKSPKDSNSSTALYSTVPFSSVATTITTNTTTAVTTVSGLTTTASNVVTAFPQKLCEKSGEEKQTSKCESMVSLLDNLDKEYLEYGVRLTTGVHRPLLPLAREQLRTLRQKNTHIDEHWARFSASVVITAKTMQSDLQPNTIILPVRAASLPFTSVSKTTSTLSKLPPNHEEKIHNIATKFAPMSGTAVRVRCPRPLTQVGVRTIPSILKRRNIEHIPHVLGRNKKKRSKVFREETTFYLDKATSKLLDACSFKSYEVKDEVKKVVDDLVSYVERQEAKDLIILEEPNCSPCSHKSPIISENTVMKKKKGPMIRELNRLDVNVIEMWDARNKKCIEEYCKLGCICESLECCRPAIEEHCGKEECMFNCKCEQKICKRGDSRQHTLLSPLTLLTIPQHNRRILAKEEKEFQQTVIRAKHETIVVGSSGSSRRKREIKLPGRYRDSYVALGKEYGLVDFNISSDESSDPLRRQTKISVVNNRELIQGIAPKTTPGISKVSSDLKHKYNTKSCFIKLVKIDSKSLCERKLDEISPVWSNEEKIPGFKNLVTQKSRNVAVKSTTLPPNLWYNPKYFAARTAPINKRLLKRFKIQSSSEDQQTQVHSSRMIKAISSQVAILKQSRLILPKGSLISIPSISLPAQLRQASPIPPHQSPLPLLESPLPPMLPTPPVPPLPPPPLPPPEAHYAFPHISDIVLDDCSESFGKIECVTTLSEEQFEKGDLTSGIEQSRTISTHSLNVVGNRSSFSSERPARKRVESNISIDKIANLLNRKIRELKEAGGNVSFPTGNEESIHLLLWHVFKKLFQSKNIQLWYYKGACKLVITSTKLRPDPKYVNLNDISAQEHKMLPSIMADLLIPDGKRHSLIGRDIYALLHFDGKHVELVGTISKNRGPSEDGNVPTSKNIRLLSEDRSTLDEERSYINTTENRNIEYEPSPSTSEVMIEKITISSPKKIFDKHKQFSKITKSIDILRSFRGPSYKKSVKKDKAVSDTNTDDVIIISPEPAKQNVKVKSSEILTSVSNIDSSGFVKQKQTEKDKSSKNVAKLSDNKLDFNNTESNINNIRNGQIPVTKSDTSSETRVRKLKTIWQSTKVETAAGENVPIPLPSCAIDSRWFVLSLIKKFDEVHIASKKCTAKERHIAESIKMASSHGMTVRLPLELSNKDAGSENANQPKFGIYAVPNISSYVFIGPCGLNENLNITKFLISAGKYVRVQESDNGEQTIKDGAKEDVKENSEYVVSILKNLCKSLVGTQNINSWLYTKRNSESDSKDTPSQKQVNDMSKDILKTTSAQILRDGCSNINSSCKETKLLNENGMKTVGEVNCKISDKNAGNEKDLHQSQIVTNTSVNTAENINPRREILAHGILSSMSKNHVNTTTPKAHQSHVQSTAVKRRLDEKDSKVPKKFMKESAISSFFHKTSDGAEVVSEVPEKTSISVPSCSFTQQQTISPTLSTSKEAADSFLLSRKSVTKKTSSSSQKSALLATSKQPKQQPQNSWWLVPSFPWIGCLPCNCDGAGELIFVHPVSGMEMKFSNLERIQLWLDRLFQSAILYIPKQLFIKWTLKSKVENEEVLQFDSTVLNGNYMMTSKGVFDIDKLVAMEADSYGLKPIEVLRLQDKKCRRDLELGLYQLEKAMADCGHTEFKSKVDLIKKAKDEIETAKKLIRVLDKERKRLKNSKHNSLVNLYNMMKGLPITTKRDIVRKLKSQYDQVEDISARPPKEVKDPSDGLNFSMSKYCVNASMFGHKSDDSDLEDYLSEYEEEDTEDSSQDMINNVEVESSSLKNCEVNRNKESSTETGRIAKVKKSCKTDLKAPEDDESVSISVVTATQNRKEEKQVNNSDEITVTCVRDPNDNNTISTSVLKKCSIPSSLEPSSQVISSGKTEKVHAKLLTTQQQVSVKPPVITLPSPVKTTNIATTSNILETGNLPSPVSATETIGNTIHSVTTQCNVKRKTSEPSCSIIPGDISQTLKVKNVQFPYGFLSGESSQLNLGLESANIKKYKTIKIGSSVALDSDSRLKQQKEVTASEYSPSTNGSPIKTNSNTVYVNVVSPTQSKILPLRVEEPRQDKGLKHNPSGSSWPSQPIKILPQERQLYVRGPHGTLPLIVANRPGHPLLQTSHSVLGSSALPPAVPFLNVKKVPKESIPPGVAPRPATILPPPLVPITDKKQSKPLSPQTTQILTTIPPLPPLFKMVDGMPVEQKN